VEPARRLIAEGRVAGVAPGSGYINIQQTCREEPGISCECRMRGIWRAPVARWLQRQHLPEREPGVGDQVNEPVRIAVDSPGWQRGGVEQYTSGPHVHRSSFGLIPRWYGSSRNDLHADHPSNVDEVSSP